MVNSKEYLIQYNILNIYMYIYIVIKHHSSPGIKTYKAYI